MDNEKVIIVDEEMVKVWMENFLKKEGVTDPKALSITAILCEIGSVSGTIDNEKLWELGTQGEENYHGDNIKNLLAYKEKLEALLDDKTINIKEGGKASNEGNKND